MNQPEYILKPGTKIVTNEKLEPATGIFVNSKYIGARRPNTKATLYGIVGGHGGDIYWAKNEDDSETVYGWWEFELDAPDTSTVESKS